MSMTTAAPRLDTWRSAARRIVGLPAARIALGVLIALGLAIRVFFYLSDRSLTLDEAFIALNIQRKSPSGLLGELDWNSAAPPAFLEIEKLLASLAGSSELVLRALPFVAALAGLFAFAKLSARVLLTPARPVSVLLFIGLASATSYAALLKPYSLDLLLVILLLLATLAVLRPAGRPSSTASLVGLGVVAPLFSYASIFALVSSAAVLLLVALTRASRAMLLRAGIVVVSWSAALAIGYAFHGTTLSHLRHSLGREDVGLSTLRQALGSLRLALGLSTSASELGDVTVGLATGCAVILFFIGLLQLFRRTWDVAVLLVSPGLFLLIAASAGWYPLLPRTMLFLLPTVVICMAEGAAAGLGSRIRGLRFLPVVLLVPVFVAEAMATSEAIRNLRPDDGMKPIMTILAQDIHSRDKVYVGYSSQYSFAYYLECECLETGIRPALAAHLPSTTPVSGVDQWAPALDSRSTRLTLGKFEGYSLEGYVRDFAHFPPGRIWVIVSFLHPAERHALLAQLDRRGTRLRFYGRGGGIDAVNAYLYAVTKP
jgi:hypothetical protein